MGTSAAGERPAGPTPSSWTLMPEDGSPALPPSSWGCCGQASSVIVSRTRTPPHLNGFLLAPCPRGHCAPCKSRVTWARHFVPCQRNRGPQIPGLDSLWTSTGAGGSGSWGGMRGRGAPARHPTLPASVARGCGWGWLCEGVSLSLCVAGASAPGRCQAWLAPGGLRLGCPGRFGLLFTAVFGVASQVVL